MMNTVLSDVNETGILPDCATWDGINALIDNYINLTVGDEVVIAYTSDSQEPASWVAVALGQRGIHPRLIGMLPLRDVGFRERFKSVLPPRDLIVERLIIITFERDTMSHNEDIKSVLSDYDVNRYQVIRAINSGADLFTIALKNSPSEISARNTAILERCISAKRLVIETRSGTRLDIGLDNKRYRWISSRGLGRPGKFIVIPAGEVATYPASISGTLVADFAINVNTLMDLDARLTSCPVTAEINQGQLVKFKCENEQMTQFLLKSFSRNNARRVGELGFGTNPGVISAVRDNSHINERRPGVHIGFGQHNQTDALTGYFCDIHIDLISQGGLIWVDDDAIPIDLDQLVPSSNPHPIQYDEEDLRAPEQFDGDCCGVLGTCVELEYKNKK